MHIKNTKSYHGRVFSHSRAYFETIVATRLWNANYGGVYVEKKGGTINPTLSTDIETKAGRNYDQESCNDDP